MGREVSLAGLFGGLGSVSEDVGKSRMDVMNRFVEITRKNPTMLNLDQFEHTRNNLDLSKINIGNVNRVAVFNAVKEIMSAAKPSKVDWSKYFRTEGK